MVHVFPAAPRAKLVITTLQAAVRILIRLIAAMLFVKADHLDQELSVNFPAVSTVHWESDLVEVVVVGHRLLVAPEKMQPVI